MEQFAARVIAARGTHGWTRRQLAKRAGQHEQHLAKVARGHRQHVAAETIIALADALNVSTDYLLGRSDTPTPQKRPRPRKTAPAG